MEALVKMAPGPGRLELRDLPIPEIGDDDLLLRVSFCGVCGSDLHTTASRYGASGVGRQEYIPEAAELIREGKLKMSAPLSVKPLTQWREALDLLRGQPAAKVLLDLSG